MAFAYSPKIVTDGLVFAVDAANTKSYPGSGTTWKDLSGNGNDGTLINGPTFDEANGGSIVFDGTNDYAPTTFQITTNYFTEEVWVYTPNTFLNENQISSQYDFSGGRYILSINIDNNIMKVRSFLGGNAVFSNTEILPNTWYQITTTRDNGNWGMYVNGTLEKTYLLGTTPITIASYYTLGRLSILSNGWNWGGKITSSKIYNRALTPSEIFQNYNALKSRFGL